jgi:hypothetical protein
MFCSDNNTDRATRLTKRRGPSSGVSTPRTLSAAPLARDSEPTGTEAAAATCTERERARRKQSARGKNRSPASRARGGRPYLRSERGGSHGRPTQRASERAAWEVEGFDLREGTERNGTGLWGRSRRGTGFVRLERREHWRRQGLAASFVLSRVLTLTAGSVAHC